MNDRIESAVDRSQIPEPPPPAPVQVQLVVHRDPAQLENLRNVTLTAPPDPERPLLMVQHRGAWLAILAEPGSQWELKRKGPGLWTPGMRQ